MIVRLAWLCGARSGPSDANVIRRSHRLPARARAVLSAVVQHGHVRAAHLYAVLLAFVVIVTWENFSDAERVVGQEASALRSLYRESGAFPQDEFAGDEAKGTLRSVPFEVTHACLAGVL